MWAYSLWTLVYYKLIDCVEAAAAAAADYRQQEDGEPGPLSPSYLDFLAATKRDKCAAVSPALLRTKQQLQYK